MFKVGRSLPFRTAVGVALGDGSLWLAGWRNSGDAAVVDTQQQAQEQAQRQRQQQVVLPVRHLRHTIDYIISKTHTMSSVTERETQG